MSVAGRARRCSRATASPRRRRTGPEGPGAPARPGPRHHRLRRLRRGLVRRGGRRHRTAAADANHAVVVTGIDDENVYLADPGDPSGAISVVPRETFEDAWSDSDHEMLVTDTAPPRDRARRQRPGAPAPARETVRPRRPVPRRPTSRSRRSATAAACSRRARRAWCFLPIVLRDVAVATAGVSALLAAAGIVRRRAHVSDLRGYSHEDRSHGVRSRRSWRRSGRRGW